MDQDKTLRRFIEKYNECQTVNFEITRWPDKMENSSSRNCDAYAEAREHSSLAIEHTRVETFQKQIEDSARFMKLLGPLESRFRDIGFSVSLAVKPFPFPKGTKWIEREIVSNLSEWLELRMPELPTGRTDHEIPGIPFRVTIQKEMGSKGFLVARWAPSEDDVPIELAQNMIEAVADKNDQLTKYRHAGDHTILVMESSDIALVNHAMLYEAYLMTNESIDSTNIDEVWMAENYDPEDRTDLWCFKAREEIMDKANPSNFMFGVRHSEHWSAELSQYKAKVARANSEKYVPLSKRVRARNKISPVKQWERRLKRMRLKEGGPSEYQPHGH